MSERINKKESMDKAIVDKVASILSNTTFPTSIDISIKGEVASIPMIDYRITENIVPSEVEE